jgi:hypothetical protein
MKIRFPEKIFLYLIVYNYLELYIYIYIWDVSRQMGHLTFQKLTQRKKTFEVSKYSYTYVDSNRTWRFEKFNMVAEIWRLKSVKVTNDLKYLRLKCEV